MRHLTVRTLTRHHRFRVRQGTRLRSHSRVVRVALSSGSPWIYVGTEMTSADGGRCDQMTASGSCRNGGNCYRYGTLMK